MSWMVRRSASRICSALRILIADRRHPAFGTPDSAPTLSTLAPSRAVEVRSLSMSAYVNVNGVITDAAHAVIPVYDHGFLYGEGVYEVFRTYHGVPFLFDRHQARLRAVGGADRPRRAVLGRRGRAPLARHHGRRRPGPAARLRATADEAYVRILLTRGVGEITYDPAACPEPSLVIIAKPIPPTPERALRAGHQGGDGRGHHPQPSRIGLAADQEQQPDQQRAGHAAGHPRRRRRSRSSGTIAASWPNAPSRTCSSSRRAWSRRRRSTPGLLAGITRAFTIEVGAAAGIRCDETPLEGRGPVRRRRGVLHQHDQGDRADRPGGRPARLAMGGSGPSPGSCWRSIGARRRR